MYFINRNFLRAEVIHSEALRSNVEICAKDEGLYDTHNYSQMCIQAGMRIQGGILL